MDFKDNQKRLARINMKRARQESESEQAPKRQAVAEASLPLVLATQTDQEQQVVEALNAYWTLAQEQIETIEKLILPKHISFTQDSLVPYWWSVSVSFVNGNQIKILEPTFYFEVGAIKIVACTLKELEPVLRSLQGELRLTMLQNLKERVEVWAAQIGRAYEVINDWLTTCKVLSLEQLTDDSVVDLTKNFTVHAPSYLPWSGNYASFSWSFEHISFLPEFLDCAIPFLKVLCSKYKESISFIDPK